MTYLSFLLVVLDRLDELRKFLPDLRFYESVQNKTSGVLISHIIS